MPDKRTAFNEIVGFRLRLAIRALQEREKGLLIGDFAAAIGASQSVISNWQKGLSVAQPQEMAAAHRLYGIPLDWLYAGDEVLLPKWLLKHVEEGKRPKVVGQPVQPEPLPRGRKKGKRG